MAGIKAVVTADFGASPALCLFFVNGVGPVLPEWKEFIIFNEEKTPKY